MSQQFKPVSRTALMSILQRISALYQINVISEETRNELAELAKKGLSDHFEALYQKCSALPTHPILDEIMEQILFQ